MPPKNAPSGASRRGGPQFKPPRPVKAPTQTTTAATSKRAPAARSNKASTSAARSKPQPEATLILSSSDDDDDDDDDERRQVDQDSNDADSDDLMEDVPRRPATTTTRPSTSTATTPAPPPPIPTPLLARLLHENFDNENTQMQKGALHLVGTYLDIFVREAFARAKHEREAAVTAGGGGGGRSDGFLQVEDLERLAPQLVLDF